MSNFISNKSKPENISLIALCLTPISFVTGSLMANAFTVILFLVCILNGQKNFFLDFLRKYKILILIFLSIVILNILFSETQFYSFTKLTSFFRFFLFSLSIIILLDFVKNNVSKYAQIYLAFIFFLVIDSYIQLFFGYDIFGFSYNYDYERITGPFKDEMIIGNYLLYFGFLCIALINQFNKITIFYNFILFLMIVITVLISGERTPFISLIYFFSILFIISSKKKFVFTTSILLVIFSIGVISFSDRLSEKYRISSIPKLTDIESKTFRPKKSDLEKNQNKINKETSFLNELNISFRSNQYVGHYSRAIDIFRENYIFGTGFKSYRKVCGAYETLHQPNQYGTDGNRRLTCSIHPHNYHLEILSDTGITGYFTFLSLIFYTIYLFFKKKLYRNFSACILFSLIITYIFPLKPAGSFFSTNSAFIFWFLIGHFFYFSKSLDFNPSSSRKF